MKLKGAFEEDQIGEINCDLSEWDVPDFPSDVKAKVDPIVWTKKERSFVTPVQVFPTGIRLLLLLRHPCGIALHRVKRRLALLASIQQIGRAHV